MELGIKAFLIANAEYGQKEIRGEKHNPRIIQYFRDLGFNQGWIRDETAWCAIFAYWCLTEAGVKNLKPELNAYSFLKIGRVVKEPKVGDLVVFYRGEGPTDYINGTTIPKMHVGFYQSNYWGHIYNLSGNFGNRVQSGSMHENKVAAYIRIE